MRSIKSQVGMDSNTAGLTLPVSVFFLKNLKSQVTVIRQSLYGIEKSEKPMLRQLTSLRVQAPSSTEPALVRCRI